MNTSAAKELRSQGTIEEHALLGDGHTTALVRFDGSIDWLCWPRFDSPACFAALLGTEDNGHWSLRPRDVPVERHRRYVDDTLVLQTEYRTAQGRVRVTDFMPVGKGPSSLVRMVTGLEGRVPMKLKLALCFDHGRVKPWLDSSADVITATVGPHCAAFRSTLRIEAAGDVMSAEWIAEQGQTCCFVLSHGPSSEGVPAAVDVDQALDATTRYWRAQIAAFVKPTDWPDAVRRSLLTLLALIHRSSGGMVAAATTSLPEKPGGSSNWDYRYCWLRDATFTMCALLNAGLQDEARTWRDWLLRALGADPKKLRIVYRVDGASDLDEITIDWLPGYEGARPVRVGNAAWKQHQLDVYGEVIDALALAVRGGIDPRVQGMQVERALVEKIEADWQSPDQGLWESRDEPRHYVYSKVMAWVGIDRYLRGAHPGDVTETKQSRLRQLRARMHADICAKGYHASCGTFVQHYDNDELDASLLLLPALGFLPATDPRMERTIDAIENKLAIDGLVMRNAIPPDQQPEGAFLACTLWLADCRVLQGRHAEARVALERVLALSNDLGLLSEEYDVREKRLSGNFPQALTHLSIVNTALSLCGPVLQRAGG